MAGLKETGLFRPTDGRLIAGRYRIVDPNPIGEGGMGVVYRGRDNRLNRDVAIKILHEKESRPEVIARFRRESEIVNSIGHDGLAIVFDCAQPEDSLIYIVMEFLDGETLRQCLDDRDQCAKLRHPQHIRHVGLRMLDTLAAVHMKNIVHRDLKPENVFLIGPLTRKYRVKIIDFGIAKFMETDVHLTRAGSVVGTPLYMSPEQVQGLPIDNRTDLYAVGCLLYEMATGRPPFVGDLCDVQQGHMHGMPEAPSDLNEEIPRALGAVIMKMMAKAPDARFPDAEATAEALEDAVPPDPLFWRNSRPPSPVSGRAVGPREPRLLPRDVRVEPRTPSDGEDDPAPTPTRLVPEEAAAARSLGDGDIGRAKTILTPTNGTTLEGHKGWVSKIPKGARWPLAILLALLVATGLVYLVLPSRSSSKETDTTADTRNTADATVRHDVIVIPQPVFVPMPPSHDAEAAAPDEVADASEAEAEATEADADAGEDVALTEATEAEVTTPPTPPADYVTHMALGEAAASAKNWRVAVDEFKAAAKAWPEGADAQRGLGNALLSLFRREEGEAAIRLYLELAPNAPDAPYYRSLIGIDEEQ